MKDHGLRVLGLAVVCQLALTACGSSDRITVPIDNTAAAAGRKAAGRAQLDAEAQQVRSNFSINDPALSASSSNASTSSVTAGAYTDSQKGFSAAKALQMSALALAPALLMKGTNVNLGNLLPDGKPKDVAAAEIEQPQTQTAAAAAPPSGSQDGDSVIVADDGYQPKNSGPSTIGPVLAQGPKTEDTNDARVEQKSTTDGAVICQSESPQAQSLREAYAIIQSMEYEQREEGVNI